MAQNARQMLIQNKMKTKAIYDRHTNPLILNIGDKVMTRNEAGHKHEAVYKGPYVVTEVQEPNVKLRDENGREKFVHKNNVKSCNY